MIRRRTCDSRQGPQCAKNLAIAEWERWSQAEATSSLIAIRGRRTPDLNGPDVADKWNHLRFGTLGYKQVDWRQVAGNGDEGEGAKS